jgi:hypothetical protein
MSEVIHVLVFPRKINQIESKYISIDIKPELDLDLNRNVSHNIIRLPVTKTSFLFFFPTFYINLHYEAKYMLNMGIL